MKIFPIEGNKMRLDGGAMFGNTPKALWSKWIVPDEQNRITLSNRTLLLQTTSGRNILLETGIGTFFEPKYKERYGIFEKEHVLLKNLASLGFRETDIDVVVLSHLHFDHAGGLLSPYEEQPTRLLFPKATYYLGSKHWSRARKPHIRERASFIPILNELLESSNRLELIDSSAHPDLPELRFHFSNGHTIGMMLSEIQLEEGPLVFVADLIPGIPWLHLPIAMGYDRFPEETVNEKQLLLADLTQRNGTLFFTHDPNVAMKRMDEVD